MYGFSFTYVEGNLVCALVFILLLINNYQNHNRQEKQIKFDRALIAFILYFITDSIWALIVDRVLPKSLIGAVTIFIYIFMVAYSYAWLDYVMAYEQVPDRNKPRHRLIVAMPFLVSTVILILQLVTAPETLINHDTLETQLGFTVYMVVVPVIYLTAILFYAIRRAGKEENRTEKHRHLFIGFFPLLGSIGGIIQTMMPYAPILCFVILILMLVFYIQSLELRVSLDPLTGLNNRGQLEKYCSQHGNTIVEGRLTVAVMMDIDKFKAINDTYGHAEGDKALVIVSNALKTVANRHSIPSFLCRYGGDEFILILHPVAIEEVEEVLTEIQEEVNQDNTGSPYKLSISAGYDKMQDSIQACIKSADEKLYHVKKQKDLLARR